MKEKIEFIKKLRRTEIRNLISDVRYFLNFKVVYGGNDLDEYITDGFNQIMKMFKVRNNFTFLGVHND